MNFRSSDRQHFPLQTWFSFVSLGKKLTSDWAPSLTEFYHFNSDAFLNHKFSLKANVLWKFWFINGEFNQFAESVMLGVYLILTLCPCTSLNSLGFFSDIFAWHQCILLNTGPGHFHKDFMITVIKKKSSQYFQVTNWEWCLRVS